jgi:hypothetical protein
MFVLKMMRGLVGTKIVSSQYWFDMCVAFTHISVEKREGDTQKSACRKEDYD